MVFTVGEIYKKQAELVAATKTHGFREPGKYERLLAMMDEVGELNHELKGLWCWWDKPGFERELKLDKVLGEAADIMCFLAEWELNYKSGHEIYEDSHVVLIPDELPMIDVQPLPRHHSPRAFYYLFKGLIDYKVDLRYFMHTFVNYMAGYGVTMEKLVDAYFKKAQENLDRWNAVAEAKAK